MTERPISDEVALRIGLAARALPSISVGDLIEALQRSLGDPLDEAALAKITVSSLKKAFGQTTGLDGDEDDEAQTDVPALKEAVRILWGETGDADKLPRPEPYRDGDMPGSVRVAVASNSGERLDGHFGSAARYLIYQVSAAEIRLVDVRSAAAADASGDKNAFRVSLIKDCCAVYLVSIGGPAAAKVIKADIHMIPMPDGGEARQILEDLQSVLAISPPPWLAKILGVTAGARVKNYKGTAAE
ncbi:dinitrogenase iron-molybdenum cofactor biosynthesis protein [Sorangium sp. So ce1024]|uniref:dinitrogenase iron-molybdenum cofactor biosynthesis protein n=1 Tax=unclassified Sorangium TaxID=2621164 RepID=UPI003F065E4C